MTQTKVRSAKEELEWRRKIEEFPQAEAEKKVSSFISIWSKIPDVSAPIERAVILDLGCRTGIFVQEALKRGLNAFGVDREDHYLGDRRRFIQADANFMPFADNTFDLVYERLFFADLRVLQNTDCSKIIREVYRIIKPGGILCNDNSFEVGSNLVYESFQRRFHGRFELEMENEVLNQKLPGYKIN